MKVILAQTNVRITSSLRIPADTMSFLGISSNTTTFDTEITDNHRNTRTYAYKTKEKGKIRYFCKFQKGAKKGIVETHLKLLVILFTHTAGLDVVFALRKRQQNTEPTESEQMPAR